LPWQNNRLRYLASVAEKQGHVEEGVIHLRRAVRVGEELIRITPGTDSIATLAESRRGLARLLARQGQSTEARSLTAANRRMLDRVPAECIDDRIAAWRILVRLVYGGSGSGSPLSPTPVTQADSSDPDPLVRLASPEVDT
jgi:hypothetical protein